MSKSIPYRFPRIYNIFLRILAKNLKQEFTYIAQVIGENKKVFELGCGTGILADYLKQGCFYTGWDLNKNFVNYCRKKGLQVFERDIFDFNNYPESDVIVISDVIHHIMPRDKELIRKAKSRTKKLIICEPVYQYRFFNMPLYSVYDRLFGDNDGINNLANRSKWGFLDEKEIRNYLEEFNPKEIMFFGRNKESFIAVF